MNTNTEINKEADEKLIDQLRMLGHSFIDIGIKDPKSDLPKYYRDCESVSKKLGDNKSNEEPSYSFQRGIILEEYKELIIKIKAEIEKN